MALIKLTVSELEGVQGQFLRIAEKASGCADTVSSVRNNLDMEISAKRNIEERLDNVKRDLTKHSENLKSYANVLNDVINEFTKVDSISSQAAVAISNWKNGAIAGSIGIIGINLPAHTGEMYNWQTQQQLEKLSNVLSLFGATSLNYTTILDGQSVEFPMEKIWEGVDTLNDVKSLLHTVVQAINNGELPDFMKDTPLSKFFEGYEYISDAEKALSATVDGDIEALTELLGKYGIKKPLKEIIKTTIGGTSVEVKLLTDLIYSDFESAINVSQELATEFTNVISNPDSNIIDYAKVIGELYSAPDKIIAQGFINVVGDYADKIGGVLDAIGIVDAPEEGYIEFYENAFEDVKDMFNTFGAEEATSILADGFKETISEQFNNTVDTMASIGKGISGFFKDLI